MQYILVDSLRRAGEDFCHVKALCRVSRIPRVYGGVVVSNMAVYNGLERAVARTTWLQPYFDLSNNSRYIAASGMKQYREAATAQGNIIHTLMLTTKPYKSNTTKANLTQLSIRLTRAGGVAMSGRDWLAGWRADTYR